jgi:hypothetical protein
MAKLFFGILVIVIIVAGIYYVVAHPPQNPFANSKLFSAFQYHAPSTSTTATGGGSGGTDYSKTPYGQQSQQTTTASPIQPQDIPAGYTLKDLSPYFHQVRIGSVSPGSESSIGSIALYASITDDSERIDVTGWLLKTNVGGVYIPQAVASYSPVGISTPGDIYLRKNYRVTMYSSVTSIGVNILLNKCIGYLQNTATFNPPLPSNCPSIQRSDVANFTGQCQD